MAINLISSSDRRRQVDLVAGSPEFFIAIDPHQGGSSIAVLERTADAWHVLYLQRLGKPYIKRCADVLRGRDLDGDQRSQVISLSQIAEQLRGMTSRRITVQIISDGIGILFAEHVEREFTPWSSFLVLRVSRSRIARIEDPLPLMVVTDPTLPEVMLGRSMLVREGPPLELAEIGSEHAHAGNDLPRQITARLSPIAEAQDYTAPNGRVFTRGHWHVISADEATYLRTVTSPYVVFEFVTETIAPAQAHPCRIPRFHFGQATTRIDEAADKELDWRAKPSADETAEYALIVSGGKIGEAEMRRIREHWDRCSSVESFRDVELLDPDMAVDIIRLDPWVRGADTEAAKAEAADGWPFAQRAKALRSREISAEARIGPGPRRHRRAGPAIACDADPVVGWGEDRLC